RYKGRASCCNCAKSHHGIIPPGDMRRVGSRPDHNEVIPRDLSAPDPMSFSDEPLLRLWIVDQNQIGVIARGSLKRLSRSLCEDTYRYSGFLCEARQDVRKQTRVFY